MQKVVGSSPIIRSNGKPRRTGFSFPHLETPGLSVWVSVRLALAFFESPMAWESVS